MNPKNDGWVMEEKGWWTKTMPDGGCIAVVNERGGWKAYTNQNAEEMFLYKDASEKSFKTMSDSMRLAEQAYKNMSRSSMVEPSLYKG